MPKHRHHCIEVLGFVPAEVHVTKNLVYVDLYAHDPVQRKWRRKRYKLNRYKGLDKRKVMARELCEKLNRMMRDGWNPWVQPMVSSPASEVTLRNALLEYTEVKTKTTTNRSHISYKFHARKLAEWCEPYGILDLPVKEFTWSHAQRYMDQIRDVRKVNSTTFNNYHLFANGIFNWMIERGYCEENPFNRVQRLRKVQKYRTLISQEQFRECLTWFEQNDPPMVTVCLFVYHTLLRPRSELLRIKVKDLDLVNGVINVSGEFSKSKRIRRPAIPPAMIEYLKRSNVMKADPDDYVVGKGLVPNKVPSGYNYMGMCWVKMRKALNWTTDKQLYSLRDSGIVQLIADGVDLHVVMRQADHQNIETTNRYIQHYFPNYAKQVQERATSVLDKEGSL